MNDEETSQHTRWWKSWWLLSGVKSNNRGWECRRRYLGLRGRSYRGTGENCKTTSHMTCIFTTYHSDNHTENTEVRGGRGEVRTAFRWGVLSCRNSTEDPGVEGRTTSSLFCKKEKKGGLIPYWTQSGVPLLQIRGDITMYFQETGRENVDKINLAQDTWPSNTPSGTIKHWPSEELLLSQEGLCPTPSVTQNGCGRKRSSDTRRPWQFKFRAVQNAGHPLQCEGLSN